MHIIFKYVNEYRFREKYNIPMILWNKEINKCQIIKYGNYSCLPKSTVAEMINENTLINIKNFLFLLTPIHILMK